MSSIDVEKISGLRITIRNINQLLKVKTPEMTVRGVPWSIEMRKENCGDGYGIFMYLTYEKKTKSPRIKPIAASISYKLISHSVEFNAVESILEPHVFDSNNLKWGRELIRWNDLFEMRDVYVNNNSITLEIHLDAKYMNAKQVEWIELTDFNMENSPAKFQMTVNNISDLMIARSPQISLNGIPFKIDVLKNKINDENNRKQDYLAIFVRCVYDDDSDWSCKTKTCVKLLSLKPNVEPEIRIDSDYDEFDCDNLCFGYSDFVLWHKVFDRQYGYVQNNSIKLEIEIEIERENEVKQENESEEEENGMEYAENGVDYEENGIDNAENVMEVSSISSENENEIENEGNVGNYSMPIIDDDFEDSQAQAQQSIKSDMNSVMQNPPENVQVGVECSICCGNVMDQQKSSTACCRHLFCSTCIENYVRNKKSCPNCNKKIDLTHINPFQIPK